MAAPWPPSRLLSSCTSVSVAAVDWPSRLAPEELWGLALALPDLGRRAWCYRQLGDPAGDPLVAA